MLTQDCLQIGREYFTNSSAAAVPSSQVLDQTSHSGKLNFEYGGREPGRGNHTYLLDLYGPRKSFSGSLERSSVRSEERALQV
jgi:hypothetical protein